MLRKKHIFINVRLFTPFLHPDKTKSPVNQLINRRFSYPEPGSNRHGLLHWCLRPTRLPIPPSGHRRLRPLSEQR